MTALVDFNTIPERETITPSDTSTLTGLSLELIAHAIGVHMLEDLFLRAIEAPIIDYATAQTMTFVAMVVG
ncbi:MULTISPECIES: hypothetical protein [Kosakonia]|uniref:hypothetical protein n=1 Tax=Kosakonia TaxID=1330547 RepID=UPI0011C04157|nr:MULTISPECIES: hypothetical protein [Kosakonia]QHM96200.1 hypothetical protein FGE25_18850 [Kosakonia sacchari]